MLTKMSLRNFKSWAEANLDMGRLTILFGTNSSGKSGMLNALLTLKQTAESFDRKRAFNFGGDERDYIDLGSYQDVVFGHDTKQRINIGIEWQLPQQIKIAPDVVTEYLSYFVRWRGLTYDVVIERLVYGIPDVFFRMERGNTDKYEYSLPGGYKSGPGRPPQLPAPESCYAIPLEVARNYDELNPLEFNRQFEALMERIYYLGPLRRAPQRIYQWTGAAPNVLGTSGEKTIDALIAAEIRKSSSSRRKGEPLPLLEQVSFRLKEMGLVEKFDLEAIDEARRFYQPRIRTLGTQADDSLVDVGFGISQILPVVVLLHFVPEGSIVLVEQPEIHLHPSAQSELADLFLDVAYERNLQLIIESHSEHLLIRLQRRIAEAEKPLATPNDICMYFCRIGSQGSQIERVQLDLFGNVSNWPQHFFGDRISDLDAKARAGLERRRQELLANVR
ncbi:MAG: DUF3696 domain-containing protein [Anaerolineae bacterium]|nr:DUF3696 domain-containing protein [Anaerolineae bacterium]